MSSLLETTLNTRDLGGHRTADGKYTVCDRIYRSDRQDHPSQRDLAFLLERGITTIVDLRTEEDIAAKPSGFQHREGFTYIQIPIPEGSGIPESVEAVPGSYLAIACSAHMPEVFRTLARAERGVMFNCSAGKDRSGVVTAILLMLCGVSDDEIATDYMLSKENNKPRFALIRERFPEVDMNIVIPRESFMRDFLCLFRGRFGSVKDYFASIGVPEADGLRLRRKLLEK